VNGFGHGVWWLSCCISPESAGAPHTPVRWGSWPCLLLQLSWSSSSAWGPLSYQLWYVTLCSDPRLTALIKPILKCFFSQQKLPACCKQELHGTWNTAGGYYLLGMCSTLPQWMPENLDLAQFSKFFLYSPSSVYVGDWFQSLCVVTQIHKSSNPYTKWHSICTESTHILLYTLNHL
jgi:hypothetical protein